MKREIILSILCATVLALPGAAWADEPLNVQVAQVDNSKYPEVTIYVSVTDARGQIVTGLEQPDFGVTEDGQEVEIIAFHGGQDTDISTVLLIDRSGSMTREGKMNGAKKAAQTFVGLMRSKDQAALVAFDSSVSLLQNFTGNTEALKGAIGRLYANGGTSWHDAVIEAADLLRPVSGRKSIILLTDGMDEDSRSSLTQAVDHVSKAAIPVYSIELGTARATTSLKRISQESGGQFYHAPSASELRALYESLAEAMQQEYAITYRSPRPTYDGTRRAILVAVGGTETTGGYLEKHLLNIRSDAVVGLAFLVPLLAALCLPLIANALHRRRALAAAHAVPPQPPPWSPPAQPVPGPPPPLPPQAPSGLVCRQCGTRLRPGASFCPRCGANQSLLPATQAAPIVCPHCGHTARPGAEFCNRCGTKLT